jgi:hypothetical protein
MSKTYRNDGPWGAGKRARLTVAEVDNNNYDDDVRLAALEAAGIGVGIDYISFDSSGLTVHMTDHSLQGPFTIPPAKFNVRGAWQNSVVYNPDDLVNSGGDLYDVLVTHTSVASPGTFDANATDGFGNRLYSLMISASASAVPAGGNPNSVLMKNSYTNYDAFWHSRWTNLTSGSFCGSSQTDGLLLGVPAVISTGAISYTIGQDGAAGSNYIVFSSGLSGTVTVSIDQQGFENPMLQTGCEFYIYQGFPSVGGTQYIVVQQLAGRSVTIQVPDGYLPRTRAQDSTIKLKQIASDIWALSGDLMPVGGALVTLSTISSTVQCDPSLGSIFSISPTVATLIVASPPAGGFVAGTELTLIIHQTTTTSQPISFGFGYSSQGQILLGTVAGTMFVLRFVSDGTKLREVSRTIAMV